MTGWFVFAGVVVALLVLDLGVFHRRAHTITMREAVMWSIFWVSLGLLFNVFVYFTRGADAATDFLTGYVLEKALSVDNLFVISVIFTYFRVPPAHQHRVLFWGIVGALVTRGLFIVLGVEMMHRFHWMTYAMGAFLVWTGIKLVLPGDESDDPGTNPVVRFAVRRLRFTKEFMGQHFFTRVDGRLVGTPLLLVLIVVESTDVVFAVDSIPAVLAITTDAFIVYTSNVFAILGLRALYFILADAVLRFHFMKHGLCLILTFVGAKMLLSQVYKISTPASLGVIIGTLVLTAVMSLVLERRLDAERRIWRKEHGLPPEEVAEEALPVGGEAAEEKEEESAAESVMDALEKIMFVHKIPTFHGLSLDTLRPLADDLHFKRVPAGEHVFRQGDPGDALYVIVEGEVAIEQEGPEGPVRISVLGPTQYFGEMALFDGAARSASCVVLRDAVLLCLARQPFLRVGARNPQMLVEVIRVLSGRLRQADTKLANPQQPATHPRNAGQILGEGPAERSETMET